MEKCKSEEKDKATRMEVVPDATGLLTGLLVDPDVTGLEAYPDATGLEGWRGTWTRPGWRRTRTNEMPADRMFWDARGPGRNRVGGSTTGTRPNRF